MAVISNINFNNYIWKLDFEVKKEMSNMLKEMKAYAENISPTDTWDFNSNHMIEEPEKVWNKIMGSLYNNTPYSVPLDYWVKWRVYKYHKWPPTNDSTVIHVGVWNRTYTRTKKEFQDYLFKKLKW